ncbi:hypothetical protein L1987_57813 [Smallanthus sonchifolius]|uniref:Uncharacterized protein n=1 Tax=Smallanthus sonchifolius TaxID=185202 RepID=A0ACB9DDU1_9ASTR|nr:hypothetical protein L1987_57813 [Smallanthus sonchifolius]
MAPKRRTPRDTTDENDTKISAEVEQPISQRVAATMEQYETNRNNDGGNGSGTSMGGAGGSGTAGGSRDASNRKATYKAFLSCNPRNFNGTEGVVGLIRWIEKMESVIEISKCTADCMVKYATSTFTDKALTWWNSQIKTLGRQTTYQLSWEELKSMMIDEYCHRKELQNIETEIWNMQMTEDDVASYTDRFNDLAILVPHMVTPEHKRVERDLGEEVRGNKEMVWETKKKSGRERLPETRNSESFLPPTLWSQRGTLVLDLGVANVGNIMKGNALSAGSAESLGIQLKFAKQMSSPLIGLSKDVLNVETRSISERTVQN